MSEIKKKSIYDFLTAENTPIHTVRTLLLFGRNSSTYKFAFCKALMKHSAKDRILYTDLRDDFLKEFVNHYALNKNQFGGGANSLTNASDKFLESDKSAQDWDEFLIVAENNIYNNVFDAFQNVGRGEISNEHKLFEHHKSSKSIVITDKLNLILDSPTIRESISIEAESRWKVVEEAWRSKLSVNLLEYVDGEFISLDTQSNGRVNLRSAIDVLMPYQRQKCFYCNRKLNRKADSKDDDFPDVDHFFPLSQMGSTHFHGINPNGVWNLVVSCKKCNRGNEGKFDMPADKIFYDKLLARNLYFFEEHRHSLKNSILLSLNLNPSNSNAQGIVKRMRHIYNYFSVLVPWKPKEIFEP